MNIAFILLLLGVAVFVLQVVPSQETLNISVSVWPPGPNIYLGECVLLQCTVESNSSLVWSYRWIRHKQQPSPTSNPRHLVSGDSYSITAVTREDAGTYECRAERGEGNTTVVLNSHSATLSVSELSPPTLSLKPSTRQIFRGERFTVRCPTSQTKSLGWILRHFSPGCRVKTDLDTDQCSPLEGAARANKSDTYAFTDARNSGLYWCEGTEGRSNAVNITVSYGDIILKTPAFPVSEGDEVVLSCQYRTGNHSKTSFFRNGAQIITPSSSTSDREIKMTIKNVTWGDEGFYKCASHEMRMESPESWLSVRPAQRNDGTTASTSGSWIWIIVACGLVLLFVIPLTIWLVRHYRYQTFCTHSCWPGSRVDLPEVELPKTKHDATEVQWDLSWMEMTTLLDKQLHPCT